MVMNNHLISSRFAQNVHIILNMTDFMHPFARQVLTFQQTKDKETILILTFYNNTTS